MNPFDSDMGGGEADVEYLDADFRIRQPGAYVTCAVTGERIPLERLRYWCVDRQEAYIDGAAATRRMTESLS